jgi:two-component system response regulator GlrR
MNVVHTENDSATPTPSEGTHAFRVIALDGSAPGSVLARESLSVSIGSHPSNDVVLDDRLVSRFHCEIVASAVGVTLKDVGSRNGTYLDGVRVGLAHVRDASVVRIGQRALRIELEGRRRVPRISSATRFGELVGESAAMRTTFAMLEQAAASDATVLLDGETGTGKERAAESIHAASPRKGRPFVVVDCGALPANLIESELFGHERGAFTGAVGRRTGAFEAAQGGTIFLDEIGELPIEMQSRLLRALESRTVQRVGATGRTPVDVRVIAATHRDLRAEVNERRFRGDLYHRLAVVRIRLPALRERPEDLPVLVRHLLGGMRATTEAIEQLAAPESIARLRRGAWSGNVRELRNHLESALVLGEETEDDAAAPAIEGSAIDLSLGFVEARRRAARDFERRYLGALLDAHGDDVAAAAAAAGVDRTYVYRILRRQRGSGQ